MVAEASPEAQPEVTLGMVQAVHAQITGCRACPLAERATYKVLGEGNVHAKIVLVGEAPGEQEDKTGLPFQGAAGKLLDDLLAEVGIKRSALFITNAIRCRPTSVSPYGNIVNIKPNAKCIDSCHPNLEAELGFLDPVLIVPMGDTALRAVLGKGGITKLRGEFLSADLPTLRGVRPVTVMPTFHPASIFHQSNNRQNIVDDLRKARAFVRSGRRQAEGDVTTVKVVISPDEVEALCARLAQSESPIVFDTETSGPGPRAGLDHRVNECLCIALTNEVGNAYVIPLRGQLDKDDYDPTTRSYSPQALPYIHDAIGYARVLAALKDLFGSNARFAAQNGKFDLHVLAKLGITVKRFADDTLLIHALIAEDAPHNLEELRRSYTTLGYYEGWKADKSIVHAEDAPYSLVPTDLLWQYAGADVDTTLRALAPLKQALRDEGEAMTMVYEGISMPLANALYVIEREGMQVDVGKLLATHAVYQTQIAQTQAHLNTLAGREINLNARAQVAQLLYQDMGLPVLEKTDSGAPSVKASVLKRLADEYPSPTLDAIARLAKQHKLRDVYLCGSDGNGGLKRSLDAQGRIHTNFNLALKTGRLSSTNPNLQNIPRGDKISLDFEEMVEDETAARAGAMIRGMFVAPPGDVLGAWDFSQLEIRISAYVCRETDLLRRLNSEGFDYHRYNASIINQKPEAEVTSAERSLAKNFGFGTQYGGGTAAVMRVTGVSLERAKEMLALMEASYPATTAMRRKAARAIEAQGWIANVFGRRRHFPTYATVKQLARNDRDAWKEQGYQERQAFNFLIQSAGSDIVSLCTIDLVNDPWLAERNVRFCLTLHDALYAYIPERFADEVTAYVTDKMQRLPLDLLQWVLPVDGHYSDHWE